MSNQLDLFELMEEKIRKIEEDRRKAAHFEDIMSRDDEDFFVYVGRDGAMGSVMRPKEMPVLLWKLWKLVLGCCFQRLDIGL